MNGRGMPRLDRLASRSQSPTFQPVPLTRPVFVGGDRRENEPAEVLDEVRALLGALRGVVISPERMAHERGRHQRRGENSGGGPWGLAEREKRGSEQLDGGVGAYGGDVVGNGGHDRPQLASALCATSARGSGRRSTSRPAMKDSAAIKPRPTARGALMAPILPGASVVATHHDYSFSRERHMNRGRSRETSV